MLSEGEHIWWLKKYAENGKLSCSRVNFPWGRARSENFFIRSFAIYFAT